MNLIRNARIVTLVTAGFAMALALMAALALVAWTSSGKVSALLDQLVHEQVPAYAATAQIYAQQNGGQACLSGLVFERDVERRRDYFKDLDGALAGVAKGIEDYDRLPKGDDEQKAWASLKPVAERWLEKARAQRALEADRDRALASGGDAALAAQALAGIKACRDLDAALDDEFDRLKKASDGETQEMRADAERQSRALRLTLLAALLLCSALLASAALLIARRVAGAVRGLTEAAGRLGQAVTEGRLDERGDEAEVSVEFRPVVAGFNATMDAFTRPLQLTADYVDRISRGDLPPKITEAYQGDFNLIKGNLNTCIDTLAALEADMVRVAEAAVEGRLEQRADAQRHQGAYRRIAEGVNRTVATLVGHLDAMPAPAMIIDRDFKIRYFNGAALKVAGRELGQVLGQRCADVFRTGDCNTERCACARAMRDGKVASSETSARPGQAALEIAYSGVPLRDGAGKVIGAFEVISDVTAVKTAMRQSQKVSEYQARETARVVAALEKVSHGDLSLELAVAAGDADTAEAQKTFQGIAAAIQRSAEAVQALTRDVASLSESAIAGTLSARADAARHQGDFRKIVEGVNRTLDAVIAPMDEAAAVLERLAARDLRARVAGAYQGDHARIKDSLNATGEALHEALAQVAASVEQVASASTQIASSAQAVAAGASEQAASLEEITSSLESVSSMTRQSADNAGQASALAQLARGTATEGAGAVEQMQEAMGKIRASAESTSQIIKDINEIAFQTNLLALNAAVEAARAGDAGRGFAVVAEEVRSLALRSKEAATKTEALIRESVRQAGEGQATAGVVGAKLGEIVAGIGKVTDIVSEIAAAAKEQATGIGQVGQAIGEMDKVTQQNASSAEQSSSAAAELSGQSEELSSMVAAFQVSRQEGRPALARPALPAARSVAAKPAASSGTPLRAVPELPRDRRFPMSDEAELRRF